MTLDEFNAYCASLPYTTHVVQWGESDVWKIGGKVFAIGNLGGTENGFAATFKCTPIAFDLFKQAEGVRPAPYLASRGMTWLQRTGPGAIDDEKLKELIYDSYRLVGAGLTKKLQRELGLLGG